MGMTNPVISTLYPLLPYCVRFLSVQSGFISEQRTCSVYLPSGNTGDN